MKKLFLALFAMVAFIACEKTEDGILRLIRRKIV